MSPSAEPEAAPAVAAKHLRAAAGLLAERARSLREGLAVLRKPAAPGEDAECTQSATGPIVELAERVEGASALKGLSLSTRSRLALVGCARLVHVALLTDEDVLGLALDAEAEALVRAVARRVVQVLNMAIAAEGAAILDGLPVMGVVRSALRRLACLSGTDLSLEEVTQPSLAPTSAAGVAIGPCYAEMLRLACFEAEGAASRHAGQVSTQVNESSLSSIAVMDDGVIGPQYAEMLRLAEQAKSDAAEGIPSLEEVHSQPAGLPCTSQEATSRENGETTSGAHMPRCPLPGNLQSLDDFEALGLLGAGSFGVVTLELHRPSGSVCALKRVSKGLVVKMGMEEKLRNEREVLRAASGSDFINRLYATANSLAHIVFVLEPCLGGDLYQVYAQHGFTGSRLHTRFYTACVACALEFLHGQCIVYRDLKPENVLIARSGYAKLTDMGIAKRLEGPTFTTCGSVAYFAPEVIAQQGYGDAVDWWALGVFTYELLAGRTPFESEDAVHTYRKIIKGIGEADFSSTAFNAETTDFIQRLCTRDPCRRLAAGTNGIGELVEHAWYSGLDLPALKSQSLTPPFMPTVSSDRDLSNFPPIDETELPPEEVYTDPRNGWDADF